MVLILFLTLVTQLADEERRDVAREVRLIHKSVARPADVGPPRDEAPEEAASARGGPRRARTDHAEADAEQEVGEEVAVEEFFHSWTAVPSHAFQRRRRTIKPQSLAVVAQRVVMR